MPENLKFFYVLIIFVSLIILVTSNGKFFSQLFYILLHIIYIIVHLFLVILLNSYLTSQIVRN